MGPPRNFIDNKILCYGVNTATCTVEEWQYEYKPKSSKDVLAKPLVDTSKENIQTSALKPLKKKAQGVKI